MTKSLQNGIFKNLSNRECEIATHIINGKRTIDIASEIGIKTNTVSTVKRNIFFKMGVKSSIDLYKLAIKVGFVNELPPS